MTLDQESTLLAVPHPRSSLTPSSSHRVSGTGGWSARGCEVVFRNESHVSCQCNHMTSFAVLMDVSRREVGPTGVAPKAGGNQVEGLGAQAPLLVKTLTLVPQNGEILPLKTLTYVALGVTLAALMITFLFLTLLRALRSNQHGIRRNLTAALGLAQLVFLLGINQADLPVRYFPSQRPSQLPAPPRLLVSPLWPSPIPVSTAMNG